jgi:hypothetical protein
MQRGANISSSSSSSSSTYVGGIQPLPVPSLRVPHGEWHIGDNISIHSTVVIINITSSCCSLIIIIIQLLPVPYLRVPYGELIRCFIRKGAEKVHDYTSKQAESVFQEEIRRRVNVIRSSRNMLLTFYDCML